MLNRFWHKNCYCSKTLFLLSFFCIIHPTYNHTQTGALSLSFRPFIYFLLPTSIHPPFHHPHHQQQQVEKRSSSGVFFSFSLYQRHLKIFHSLSSSSSLVVCSNTYIAANSPAPREREERQGETEREHRIALCI